MSILSYIGFTPVIRRNVLTVNNAFMVIQLLLSVLIFYGILIITNIPAPLLGLDFGSGNTRLWFAPPGYVIPVVWFILFTLLGIARYRLLSIEAGQYQYWLFLVAFLCAAYAYYTLGLEKLTGISALWFGLAGNLLVIAVTGFVVIRLYPVLPAAALLTFPIVLWTSYATLIVLGEMRVEKLI